MSPLPERRKSPEELAELRKSLGIEARESPEVPDKKAGEAAKQDGGGEREELEKAVHEPPAESVPRPRTELPPVRTLRKSAQLPVDQPKPPQPVGQGKLPVRRHTDEELRRLGRMQSSHPEAALNDLAHKTLSRLLLIVGYGWTGLTAGLLIFDAFWLSRVALIDLPFDWMRDMVSSGWQWPIMLTLIGGGAGAALAFAAWVARCRPLSRHHAGFIAMLAILVLAFGALHFFPTLHGA